MIDKFCIIIDDEPQTEIVEDLIHKAKAYHINLECVQLNPQDHKFSNEVKDSQGTTDFVIDIDKIIEELQTPAYLRRRVDILVCDYNLQDKQINGFEIIKRLRNTCNFRKKIILYSATIDDVVEEIISKEERRVANLRNLVNAKISDFRDKDYTDSVLQALRGEQFSLDSEIEVLLDNYGDWTFKTGFPLFGGKKISEIVSEIRLNSDNGISFQKAILENAIAHMIDLNKDLNE